MERADRAAFFRFVVPSVLAFALSGVYTIVDGFFVGNSLGDLGLAAITLGYPVCAFIQAAGTGVGLAGAIRFTILRGQGREEEAGGCAGGTAVLLAAVSVLLTGLVMCFLAPLLRLLGAEGETFSPTAEYVRVIALGAALQVFATGLVPFIRNLGGAAYAMGAMIGGFLTNIALDYLFVWVLSWGMAGAAWATLAGQGVTMLAAVWYLARKKAGFRLTAAGRLPGIALGLLRAALAPFGLTFSPTLTMILMNRFLMDFGGEGAVAAYGCVSYVTAIVYLLLQGVGDGSQPLISGYFSRGKLAAMQRARHLAYLAGGGVAAACLVVLLLLRGCVGTLFGASHETNGEVARVLPLFLATLLPLAYVRITTAFLYATERSCLSYLLVYAEPVLLLALLLALPGPAGLGVMGAWLAVPLAQATTWIIALCVKHHTDRTAFSRTAG